ncbi:MAG: shikimate kinase [Candidatus Omnitrophica bacterium CG_4_9_14_0_2_um_filter_42_8]|nr:MAG: shikimate kinase [Candidatus Omnitrophica bacterium CG22_combo_CG10-13_8_21_14_all_43_16]PJC47069.1 MAG: shikimate kinase [Candidatus Omnitrophica bacterium CG_4_9_14_0_2_um_filter_42_8]
MKNIILVGFMGTGKSAAGKKLAAKLDRDFIELDDMIEAREKMSIKDIFDKKGEPYFRQVEKEVVKEAAKREDVIMSAGGGAVVDEENFRNMKNSGIIICLKASPETILKRTKNLKTRPLLNVPDPKKQIEELLKKREPHYNKADFSIDTDNLNIEQVSEAIIKNLS